MVVQSKSYGSKKKYLQALWSPLFWNTEKLTFTIKSTCSDLDNHYMKNSLMGLAL